MKTQVTYRPIMLIGIHPLLSPDLLSIMRAMGHGDEIAIVDGNYPASSDAKRLVRADGLLVSDVLSAILEHFPLDHAVDDAAFRAVDAQAPEHPLPAHIELASIIERKSPGFNLNPLAPDAFYGRVKSAYAIVATSDPKFYCNVILRKGVIPLQYRVA